MPALEANVASIWIAKQAAKGTPAAAPATNVNAKKLRLVGGDVDVNPAHGSEPYAEGARFADATDFVDSISGGGAPVAQGDPGTLSYLLYLMRGGEATAAAVAGVVPHTFDFGPAGSSSWFTAYKRIGQTHVRRARFNDCRMSSLRIEGSSASKVVKVTPTMISLDPGEIVAADPAVGVEDDKPFLYTEAVGTFTINGVVFRGHSSFAVVINDGIAPWTGDDVTAHDVTTGLGSIVVEGITILVDAQGLETYNNIVYGTPNPGAGIKPAKTVFMGSYEFVLTRGVAGTLRSASFELPNVHWTPDVSLAPSVDGGPVELALGAEARTGVVDGTPGVQLRSIVKSLDIAYSV